MNVVASNIKEIAQSNGIKHYVIARKAGMSPKAFSDMLNGRKLIKASDIPPLAKALGVEPGELFKH